MKLSKKIRWWIGGAILLFCLLLILPVYRYQKRASLVYSHGIENVYFVDKQFRFGNVILRTSFPFGKYFDKRTYLPGDRLVSVSLHGLKHINGIHPEMISCFPELEAISATSIKLFPHHIEAINSLTNLKQLRFVMVDADAFNLSKNASHANIESLTSHWTPLKPSDVSSYFSARNRIRMLHLHDIGIDTAWVDEFEINTSCEFDEILLIENTASTEFLEKLASHVIVRSLRIDQLTDKTIEVLKQLKGLERLTIHGKQVDCPAASRLNEIHLKTLAILLRITIFQKR